MLLYSFWFLSEMRSRHEDSLLIGRLLCAMLLVYDVCIGTFNCCILVG